MLALPSVADVEYFTKTAMLQWSSVLAKHESKQLSAVHVKLAKPSVPGARMLEMTWHRLASTVMSWLYTLAMSRLCRASQTGGV